MQAPTLAQKTPYAYEWQPKDGEPSDATIAISAHPHNREPERVYFRADTAAEESGYAGDNDEPTGQRWYEVVNSSEEPDTWTGLVDGHDGPIFIVRIDASASSQQSATAA